jgi:SAM-dependent methyltransferase
LYDFEALHAGKRRAWAEPFSLQWFLNVENSRHGRHGQWLPRLLEFTKHSSESLLGLGDGLGTDWVQYARNGAAVTAVCPSTERLALVQRNFELRGLRGVFVHADPCSIPVEAASIDVVCLQGLLAESANPAAVVQEVYRVLKPGGKVLALAPARYDIAYWQRRFLPWTGWFLQPTQTHRLSGGFSAGALRQLFARFVEPRVYKRHLRRGEVPHVWRWMPHPVLERLLGRLLLLKAFKPLSSAISVHAAA